MISLFDAGADLPHYLGTGYSGYTANQKIECVRRYFSDPPISIRELAKEAGVPFSTLSDWVRKARKAGMTGPGAPEAFAISIGKAALTLPSLMLGQALEALSR